MTKRIQVLYVDDEPGLLEIGKIYLEESSEFSVDTVQSAPAALDILNKKTYDAIVSDFMMPKMNGIELLKNVRAFDKITPFILFTGRGREEVVIDAINNGADFYIQKGGDVQAQFAELSHKIRQAVLMRRTQMTLAEQEQRYHDLQNANDLIQSVAPDGHFLFVNKKWLDTLGYQEDELPNLTIFDVIHEESLKHCMTTFQRVISGENIGIIDATFRTKDGKKVYVEGMANCKLVEGTCQYTRGIFKDITDRKKTEFELLRKNEELTATEEELRHNYDLLTQNERKLRENEAKYRDLAELLPQMIFETDLDLQITYANQQAHTLLGFSVQDLERGINALSLIDPSQHVNMRGNVQKSLSGIPFEPMEYTALRKDGSTFPVSIYSSCLYRNNTLAGFRAVVVDISARKKMEEGIYESEKKFRALVELSLDGIFITDFTGKLLFVNQAAGKIVDAPNYEAMIEKKNVMEYVAPESQADVLRDISKVAQGIDAYLVHYKLITETKREVWVECIGKKIPFGDASAMLVSMRDITGRKRDEERVRESEKKFATIFRNSPVSLTLVSATDGTFIDVNDAFLRSTGYSRHEVVGSFSVALGIFADKSEYKRFSTILRNQRTVHGMEMKCRIKNGEIRTCRFSSGIIMMDGKPHILSTVDDITEQKATELALQALVRSMVGTTGLDSLGKITENVSSWLGADCVMVGEIQPDRQTVKVLSMLLDRKEVHDFSYTLKGTPCENVADKGFCLYPDNAIALFPESKDLVELKIRGYIGTPLRNSGGHVIGILCALSRSPLTSTPTIQEIMDIIAVKAAAEIERIQTERALNESELLFREVFDNANDSIFLVERARDGPGKYLLVNNKSVQMLGYSKEELLEMSPRDIVPEDIAKKIMSGVIKKLVREGQATFESENRRKDGSIIPIEVSICSFRYKGKDVDLSIIRDITERKQAEEGLGERERFLSTLISNLPGFVYRCNNDPEWTMEYMSDGCRKITGYAPDDFVGNKTLAYNDIIHPEFRKHIWDTWQNLLEKREIVVEEYPIITKTGETRWVWERGQGIFSDSGQLLYLEGFITDITERKRAENALQHLTEFQKSIITNARVWMSVLDGKGKILMWNTAAEEISGYPSEDVVGRNEIWKMLYPDKEYRKQITDTITRIIRQKKYLENFETIIYSKQGDEKIISWNTKEIPDTTGRITNYIVIGVDVTDRQRAEEALREANKKLNLLSSITRHDINNQLLVLNSFLIYLHRKAPDPALEEYFTKIEQASLHISAMIQFTKEYEEIGINAPVWQDCQRLVETTSKRAPLGKVIVKNEIPVGTEIFADPLIVRVFYNLMDNALRHGGKITTIRFSVQERKGNQIIVCEDDGDGVPAGEKVIIFERGYGKHTGLGLALSREILSITGVTIVENGEPGKGARFEIAVPKGAWRIAGNGS
ncbi:MAG: PAS domain S-box protein [Methanoregula sp.]